MFRTLNFEPFAKDGKIFWQVYKNVKKGGKTKRVTLGVTDQSPPPAYYAAKDLRNLLKYDGSIYDLTHKMVENDPEIYGAVKAIALQVEKAFRGIRVRTGTSTTDKERKLQTILNRISKHLKIKKMCGSIAYACVRDGDSLLDKSILANIRPLPMRYMTATEKTIDIGNPIRPCFKPNYYVINEQGIMDAEVTTHTLSGRRRRALHLGVPIPAHNILHFAIDNFASIVYDNVGRWTFGVWSIPPLHPLKTTFVGKVNLLQNDILYRHAAIPRKHHQLDMSSYQPGFFDGESVEGRFTASKVRQQEELAEYTRMIRWKEADEDYVTSNNIEIGVVEPKSTHYASPNEMLSQMTDSVTANLGVTHGSLVGKTPGSFASEIILMAFATLRAEQIAENIAEGILRMILPMVVRILEIDQFMEGSEKSEGYTGITESEDWQLLESIYIDTKLVYGEAQSRQLRDSAIMAAMGSYSEGEVRERSGYPELDDNLRAYIVDISTKGISGSKVGSDLMQQFNKSRATISTDTNGANAGTGDKSSVKSAPDISGDEARKKGRSDTDRPMPSGSKEKSQKT